MSKYITADNEIEVIKNNDLICKYCIYKAGSAATCIAYENGKPLEVIENRYCEYFRSKKTKR